MAQRAAERVKRAEARRRQRGDVSISLWANKDWAERLDAHRGAKARAAFIREVMGEYFDWLEHYGNQMDLMAWLSMPADQKKEMRRGLKLP